MTTPTPPAAEPIPVLNPFRYRPLSRQQHQILTLVAAGHTDIEIGKQLYLTLYSVKTQLQRAYRHLGARNRAHAVNIAWQRGLLGSEQP